MNVEWIIGRWESNNFLKRLSQLHPENYLRFDVRRSSILYFLLAIYKNLLDFLLLVQKRNLNIELNIYIDDFGYFLGQ